MAAAGKGSSIGRLAALTVALGLLFTATPADADAAWYMRHGQAKNESKGFVKDLCRNLDECIGWAVGPCYRKSTARFSCTVATWFPGLEPGEEIECQQVLHWGVRRGYVALKRTGRPHCS